MVINAVQSSEGNIRNKLQHKQIQMTMNYRSMEQRKHKPH